MYDIFQSDDSALNMDFVNFCTSSLEGVRLEDGYINGYFDADDETYEEFMKKLNSLCGGFVVSSSHTVPGDLQLGKKILGG